MMMRQFEMTLTYAHASMGIGSWNIRNGSGDWIRTSDATGMNRVL